MIRNILVILFLMFAGTVQAEEVFVDARLIFVLDQSGSMEDEEFQWQVEGYADALADPEILNTISNGPHGQIAVAVVLYGYKTETVLSWQIYNSQTAEMVSNQIRSIKRTSEGGTPIGRGLIESIKLLRENDYHSIHDIIIVSGDADNSTGISPDPLAQEIATNMKVTIIGAPIFDEEEYKDLDIYYKDYVIAGVGRFVHNIRSEQDFVAMMKRLFVFEGRLQ